MTAKDPKDLNELKVEITKDLMRNYIANVITTQERIMFLNTLQENISKKKEEELTESDKKLKREYEANLATFMEGINDSDTRIQNFLTLIKSYEENKPLKF